jgi:hypothetical protein
VKSYTDVNYNISPESHLYEFQSDGTYKIALTLTNVQISNPTIDTTPIVRYAHPNLLADEVKNVRIVDFAYSDNKPLKYGEVIFGENTSGDLQSQHQYLNQNHLKYWTTNGRWNHFYRTDQTEEKNVGDYFLQITDYSGNIPSISWFLSNNTAGTDFGVYTASYSFSGLHRVFFPWGKFESAQVRFDAVNSTRMCFVFGGFTCPINHALLVNGYQTGAGIDEIAPPADTNTPNAAVAAVTADACQNLKTAAGNNTRVYVIKYGSNAPSTLDSCGATEKTIYSASNESDLNAKLQEIADDIKSFAGYSGTQVEENIP